MELWDAYDKDVKAIPHKSRNNIKQKENTRQISRVHNKYSVLY